MYKQFDKISRNFAQFAVVTVVLVAFSFISATAAAAKTLYVNGSTGSDATSYAANGPTNPWRTIGRAAWGSTNRSAPNGGEAARGGDTVLIAAGTYTTTGAGYRYEVAYLPANSGSAGNYITFEGQGTVVLNYSGGIGPVIGAYNRNYIRWKNFTINEANANYHPDTGPVIAVDSHHVILEQLRLTGRNAGPVVGDNYNGIRLERATDVEVRNCIISGFGRSLDSNNHTGITTYYSGRILIEHNEIANSGTGIYLKANFNQSGPPFDFGYITIRLNSIHDNVQGISFHRSPNTAAAPTLVYQNIFANHSQMAFWFKPFDSGNTDPRHAKVFNNTFINNETATAALLVLVDNSGNLVQNNIFVGAPNQFSTTWRPENDTNNPPYNSSRLQWVRNLAYGMTSYGNFNSRSYNLAGWKTATGQDVDSISSDPMFVNSAAGDYRLGASSPARTLGRAIYGVGGADGATIPAGAYITGSEIIGPGATGSVATPSAPLNLRVLPGGLF